MKNFINLAWVAIYLLGTIGGLGYALTDDAYLIAAAIIGLGVMAFPKFMDAIKGFGHEDSGE